MQKKHGKNEATAESVDFPFWITSGLLDKSDSQVVSFMPGTQRLLPGWTTSAQKTEANHVPRGALG